MISFLPEHYLLTSSLLLLTFGIIYGLSPTLKFPFLHQNTTFLSILILINFIIFNLEDLVISNIFYNFFFFKDNGIQMIELILSLFTILILGVSYFYNKQYNLQYWEYPILILFSITSLFFLISSNEFITFYFILEFQSICFYILAAYNRKSKKSIESGIKYFILGSFSSILLLLGFSFIYTISGLTHFEDLYFFFNTSLNQPQIIYVAMILMLVAFMFKMYAAPFHFWVSDVYQGAPTSSVMFFATVPMLSFFFIITKFFLIFFVNFFEIWKLFFLVICMCSLILGTLGALYQQYIKRLMAYSSIMNMGFITAAFLINNPLMSHHTMNYIILYVINTLAVLLVFSNLMFIKKKQSLEIIHNLVGFFKQNKLVATLMMCFFYTLAGLPPFSFFFSKLMILTTLMQNNSNFIIYPIVLATLISSFYYVRVIQLISYTNQKNWLFLKPIPYMTLFILVLIFFFNLFYLINSSSLNIVTYYISLDLYL